MSPKEMFKQLNYEWYEDELFIYYRDTTDKMVKYDIVFSKEYKCVEITPKVNGIKHHFIRLDDKLLQAINKQMQELEVNI